MAHTVPQVDQPGDAELISAVRGGDVDAYGRLFERHVGSARRLARQLVSPGEADDLVSEAFVKVLTLLQRGGGPDVAFRAYLLTAIRRLRVDRLRAGSRLQTTDDIEMFDPGIPFRDTAVEGFDSRAAARAFASLPERWQLVLWHTEVEGHRPADVGPLLGMTPNSVSALAYRAREGLRQAFLNEHAVETEDDLCRWTHQHLGGYVRGGLSRRDTAGVEDHLGECRRCMAIYLELTEVNDNLAGLLAPLLLGGLATGYLAAGQGTAATGGLVVLLGRIRDGALAHAGGAVAGGVVTAGVVAGGTWWAVQDEPPTPPASVAPAAEPGQGAGPDRDASAGGSDGPRIPVGSAGDRPTGDTAAAGPRAPAATGPAPTTAAPPPTRGDETDSETDDQTDDQSDAGSGATLPDGARVGTTPGPGGGETDGDRPGTIEETVDLAVSAAVASSSAPPVYDITATVTGIPPGGSATLTLRSDDPALTAVLMPGACEPPAGRTLTCTLSADGTIGVTTVAPQGGTVVLSVTGPSPEARPSDNTTTVPLV